MAQIFKPTTNTLARLSIVAGVLGALAAVLAVAGVVRSSYMTGVGVEIRQPVPFSHRHHVGDAGIDCRYCHTSVEESSFAGIPATKVCMNCHTQIWVDASTLRPVRESWQNGKSLEWIRVHKLADFVYFNHSIHVNKGVGCVTCHGRVDEMHWIRKTNSLYMDWCLECHRAPERFIRPREYVFSMDWKPSEEQLSMGRRLVKEYRIQSPATLTSCSTCHH
jgi:hypothetical protein